MLYVLSKYEDYMHSILGYPVERQNTYSNYNTNNCLRLMIQIWLFKNMPREINMYK